MKENNINQSINYDSILDKLPNMEKAAEIFQHMEGCLQTVPLRQSEAREITETMPGPYGIRFGPRFVREVKKYLVCEECHTQERYYD